MFQDTHQTNVTDSKTPFQAQVLQEFVGQVGRLFYDDACIVLLDFLAREQRAFQENDLRDILGWRESLIQQKLYLLDKQLLVTQTVGATSGGGSTGGRRSPFWRISHQIHAAVQLRYQQLSERLTKLVEDATEQHEFECSNAGCGLKHTALDVASCSRTLEDEHPLCFSCGSFLKTSAFEETLQLAKEKRCRALEQLDCLRQSLLRIQNMDIPFFPPFTKQDKEMATQNTDFFSREINSHDTGADKKNATLYDGKETMKHSTSDPKNRSSQEDQTKHKFHDHSAKQTTSSIISLAPNLLQNKTDSIRSEPSYHKIPWFDEMSGFNDKKRSSDYFKGSMDVTAGVSKTEAHPLHSERHDMKNQEFSIGNDLTEISTVPSKKSKLDPCQVSNTSTVDSSSVLHQKATTNDDLPQFQKNNQENISSTFSSSCPTLDSEFISTTHSSEKPPPFCDEIEIEISRLNRRYKLSEITEDMEQYMTDEEYKIYYNATPELALCGGLS